ncbi:conserved hypothetical protein [Talaromyces stipitatus ATCC 10500]|uniref:Uncharacterized protein n=1 Tax=Talaromyces stipitatus (strain ATCC 10500 / CBS 375.48 / QM 6759 / NRRL 1006) TaxID=441959 RepID=B8MNG5_TALSN|nr:uncharacterized protein TSTA_102810 [Talaromyces stipitatus ATCC 10500]EED14054.1 conserved hypothetical protein [Talaromyces stipitatus ATCC 10500]
MSGSNPFRRSKIITSVTTAATDESVLPSIPMTPNTSGYDGIKNHSSSHQQKIVRIATPPTVQASSPTGSSIEKESSYFPAVSFGGSTYRSPTPPPPSLQAQAEKRYEEDSESEDSEYDGFDPRSSGDQPRGKQLADDSSSAGRNGGKERKNVNNMLDVDAFTRLLLTGSVDGSGISTGVGASRRTASNPDTVIDRAQTWIPTDNNETGKNGVESMAVPRASTFSSTTTASTDVQRTPSLRKPKPPPPRSHHGKPIKPDESGRDTPNSSTPTGSPSDRRESVSSTVKISSPTTEHPDDTSSLHRSSSQSKRPPTPPLSRRHSQMRSNTKRYSLTEKPNRLSLPPPKSLSQLPGPISPGPKTPPRPPSRRAERPISGIQPEQPKSSLSQSESTSFSDQVSVDEPAVQIAASTSLPPSRTPSIKQAPATGMLPPPPPPPRRLRASSKGSTATIPSDNKEVPTEDGHSSSSQAQDILADLSRLQREVDDLRVHYEGRKVSQ